ncbi:uncharacterized protein ttc6 [Paramisgurnus dabryanus]|uniref:uncharacterized protein ttc6 n=1 Tax=Paramisgurnus dabryanus TaxID=90735 RepID=UPI003CCF5B0E
MLLFSKGRANDFGVTFQVFRAERYKTIHHLCTTSASQIVPVELQFASRFCHTQNLVTVTAPVDQQMAAPGQLSHPDIKRLVCEGVSAKSAEVSSHSDCISHLPKQLSDTLEDWKRIAEFYVERPQITMCGRAVTRPDQYKDNLLDDVVESVSHVTVPEQARRPHSAPHLTPDPEPLRQLRSDFNSLSQELEHVRLQKKSVCVPPAGEFPPSARRQTEPKDVHTGPDSSEETCQIPNHRKSPRKRTDRANVSRFKRRAANTKRKLVSVKMAYVRKKLSEPPRTLKRSESMCQLPWNPKPSEGLSSPLNSLSLPLLLDFESFTADRGGIPDTTPPREWVRDLWDVWFDELFPPLEKVQSTVSVSVGMEENQTLHDNIQELDIVDMSEVLDEGITTADVEQEVAKLTQVMSERGNHSAFDLTRRGALQIKLGHLNLALEDLNAAISLEPHLLDAYWHRHNIYLLRNDPNRALADLNIIIKNNMKHADAFMSRAEIYKERGETTAAIINYTQAIEAKPDNPDMYFRRAQMYEKMGEMLLAMEDYAKTFSIDSTRTDAMMILGMQHFRISNWMAALDDFSLLLKQEPTNAAARTYRGMIYTKLGCFEEAIKDLSLAVHLNPSDWLAFYHRGFLLRKIKPQMALRDLSTSVLINDSVENLKSFLHRGLLYAELRLWRQATADFEAVIKLDRSTAVAHVSLGLISMMKMDRNYEAIKKFSNALKADPTYMRAYVCRAKAFYNESEDLLVLQALDAFNSAVSIKPDYAEAYHHRGLCRMRLQDSMSVQDFNTALRINPNLYQVHLSRAALYGAEGRYAKAVLDCSEAIRIQPQSVKAYLYKGALQFYLKAYKRAVEDLSTAIRIDSACSFAYYNRAVCYQQLQDYELALRDYSIVLLLLGEESELGLKVLINRGLLYVELNDYSNALQDFKAAAHKRPDDAIIHHTLGVINHRLGWLKKAVDAYSNAIRLDPFLQDAYVGRGNVFMDYGHSDGRKQAQRDFISALHLNPLCSNARIGLAYNLRVLGFFKRAWNQFTVAMEVNHNCWAAYEGRAVVSLQMGNLFAALQDINTAIKVTVQMELLFTNRGLIQQLMGDKASAMMDYQKAIGINPNYALAHFNAATLFFYNGQFEQACEFYSRAFELDPSDESAILNRAITHTLLRKIPEALQDFSEALLLDPLSAHVYFNRANLFCTLRQHQSAEKDLTQALCFQPGDALLYKLRADVRACLGWTEQAMEDYRTAVKLEEDSI